MAANDSRPVNLDLTKFSFPVTAIASIAHRVCAVISWVGLGVLIWAISASQNSAADFANTAAFINSSFIYQFCVWGMLSSFGYYCLGTAKHLIQDLGYFEDFAGGKTISWASLIGGGALSIFIGVAVWA